MFHSRFSSSPHPIMSLLAMVMIVFLAATSISGVARASTETTLPSPGTEVDNPLSEFCERAVETFDREIEWIYAYWEAHPDFHYDDPELVPHRDAMWAAMSFAEDACGINVWAKR